MAIVNRGRVVAAGRVDELRASPRLRVAVDGAPPGWAERLDGVTVVGRDEHGLLVELGAGERIRERAFQV